MLCKDQQTRSERERAVVRILHLRHTFTDGGAEKMLINWFRHYDQTRFEYQLACFANPDGSEQRLVKPAQALGVVAHVLPWGRRKRLFAAVRSLVKVLRRYRIEVVHSHDAKSDLVAWLARLWTGVSVVGSAYGWFGNRSARRVIVYEALALRLLSRFDAIIAVSESLRRESIERGLDPGRLHLVRTGIDYHDLQRSPDREALRRSLGLRSDDKALVNLARMWPEKGQTYLLHALKRVVRQHPNVRLVIIGEGPLESTLRAQAEELGVDSHLTMAGFPSNIPDLLQVFDGQVHSSVYEGLPIALLQGMAAGLPVVATDVGGVHEVCIPEETALLVPPSDPEALANGMLRLLDDEQAADRLGRRAQLHIQQHYSMESATDQLGAVYEWVLEQRGKGSLP